MTLKNGQDCLLLSYMEGFLDEEEFCALYDVNSTDYPVFEHGKYRRFDLNEVSEEECFSRFRFSDKVIPYLGRILRLPETFVCENRTAAYTEEGLYILLQRLAYPCRYPGMITQFGRSPQELSLIANKVMDEIYEQHGHLLTTLDPLHHPWLTRQRLREMADAVYAKGAALPNCWGFVDGTVRPICRPSQGQHIFYNGHKRVHSLKFEQVLAANGIIVRMFGPIEGRKHDVGMLRMSGLYQDLEGHSWAPDGTPLCVYGDPAYPHRVHLQVGFKGARLTPAQERFNQSMSDVRATVEWSFGEITTYWAFTDFKKNLKIGMSAVGKQYLVATLLKNALVCCYGSQVSQYFDLAPPKTGRILSLKIKMLREYLGLAMGWGGGCQPTR